MAWYLTGTPRTIRVTRRLAKSFAGMDPAPNDRGLKDWRLAAHRAAAEGGTLRPVEWAACYCAETGKTYRVNGKHTSTVLSELAAPTRFYATVENYRADTLADVAALYATFDSRTTVRSTGDINRAFAAAVPELAALPSWLVDKAITGVAYALHQDSYANDATPADRAERILHEVPFVAWLDGLLRVEGVYGRIAHLYRGPVVGAMYLCFKKDAGAATAFWTAVRDETGESPSDPDRWLARWLATTSINHGRGRNLGGRLINRAGAREVHWRCLAAWNSWRGVATPSFRRYRSDSDLPAVA